MLWEQSWASLWPVAISRLPPQVLQQLRLRRLVAVGVDRGRVRAVLPQWFDDFAGNRQQPPGQLVVERRRQPDRDGDVPRVDGSIEGACVLITGADTLETIAIYVSMLGMDFRLDDGPEELVAHVRTLGQRYLNAVERATSAEDRGEIEQ